METRPESAAIKRLGPGAGSILEGLEKTILVLVGVKLGRNYFFKDFGEKWKVGDGP